MNNLYNMGSTDYQKPYNVDVYLNNYMSQTSISTNIDFQRYFRDITSAALAYDPVSLIDNETRGLGVSIRSYEENPAASTCPPVKGSESTTIGSGNGIYDSGGIDKNDINLLISETTESIAVKTDIVNLIDNNIGILSELLKKSYQDVIKTTGDNNVYNHVNHGEFDEYLHECNRTITTHQFVKAFGYIEDGNNVKQSDSDLPRLNAIAALKVINVPWKLNPLILEIEASVKECLYTIISKLPSDASIAEFAKGFHSRDSMKSGSYIKYYYMLRSLLNEKIKISKSILYEDDAETNYFIRKLLSDLYIKTAYPMIHFHLLSVMMKVYMEKGDFINARFAMLAKCTFTYYFMRQLVTGLEPNIGVSVRNDVPINIINYIKRNNKGKFNGSSKDENIASIMVELHEISNQVVDISQSSNILQQSIEENQLNFRNITAAIKAREGEYKWKVIQYWVEFAIMLILIAACGILYYFGKIDIGIMVAGGSCATVILIVLILMIISFITKN